MRLLTLIRHAKSSWDDPGLNDFERPLNARGRRDAPRMAEHVLRHFGRPDRLVSSPALRAITTARIFSDTGHFPVEALLVLPRIYEASGDTLRQVLLELPAEDIHVALFGHNPGLSELAHGLAPCPFDELPTCGAVQIELPLTPGVAMDVGGGVVRHYAAPKLLRD